MNGSIDSAMAKLCPPAPSGNRVGGYRKKSRKRKEAKERETIGQKAEREGNEENCR